MAKKDMENGMSSSDTNDENGSSEESSPKTRVKKVMIKETFAKGGKVEMRGCKPCQTSGRKYAGVY